MKRIILTAVLVLSALAIARAQEFSVGINGSSAWDLDSFSSKATYNVVGANLNVAFKNKAGLDCYAFSWKYNYSSITATGYSVSKSGEKKSIFMGLSYRFLEYGKLYFAISVGPMLGLDQNDNAIEKYVTEEDYLEIPQKDYIHLGIAGKLESVYRFGKHFAAFAAITYSHDKKFWGRLNNTDSFTLVGDHAYGNNGHTSLVVKFIF